MKRRAEGVGDFHERTAALVLQTLGVARAEAHTIVNRPLQSGDFVAAEGDSASLAADVRWAA